MPHKISLLAVTCALALSARAQSLSPILPDPIAVDAQHAERLQDAGLESYLQSRLGTNAVLEGLYATATDGIVAAELESSWLHFHVRIATADAAEPELAPYAQGDAALEELLSAFAQLQVAPEAQLEAKLQRLGVHLADVYAPATPPYFNNAKGVVWSAKQHRFVLSVRGTDDAQANRCFKAALDLSNGDLITRASTPCVIE